MQSDRFAAQNAHLALLPYIIGHLPMGCQAICFQLRFFDNPTSTQLCEAICAIAWHRIVARAELLASLRIVVCKLVFARGTDWQTMLDGGDKMKHVVREAFRFCASSLCEFESSVIFVRVLMSLRRAFRLAAHNVALRGRFGGA